MHDAVVESGFPKSRGGCLQPSVARVGVVVAAGIASSRIRPSFEGEAPRSMSAQGIVHAEAVQPRNQVDVVCLWVSGLSVSIRAASA